MLITHSATYQSGLRKYNLKPNLRLGPFSVRVITLILAAILGLFYLSQTTQSSTKTYQIQDLTSKQHQMEVEKERLQIEAIRLKSLNEIQKTTSSLNLEPVKKIN